VLLEIPMEKRIAALENKSIKTKSSSLNLLMGMPESDPHQFSSLFNTQMQANNNIVIDLPPIFHWMELLRSIYVGMARDVLL